MGRGLRSVEMEYKGTRFKGTVRLYCNQDPAIQMMREFEGRAEEMGRRSMVKEALRFAEELGVELNLEHLRIVKTELRKCQVERLEEDRNQRRRGSLVIARFIARLIASSKEWMLWWLTECKSCPNDQLLPTRLYARQKTQTSSDEQLLHDPVLRARRGVRCAVRPQKVWLTSCLGAVRWHRASSFPDTTQP